MYWESKGLIFNSSKLIKSIKSHAWVPTPHKISKGIYKIFYAGRDKFNHSNIYSFDFSLDKKKILKYSKTPILKKGRLGCFDDCAVIPSHVLKINKKFYMYYIGWTKGGSVPYISSLGLAISKSLNGKFKRVSEAPILGRTDKEPIFVASCFVEKTKRFKMYYTSNKHWRISKNNNYIPRYNIKYATSKNGLSWETKSDIIKFKSLSEIAITRPWIIKINNKKIMFYSFRGRNYKIGMAVNYKNKWVRFDNKLIFKKSKDLSDNIMHEYGAVVSVNRKFFMFYNGNNYGEKGICLAELKK